MNTAAKPRNASDCQSHPNGQANQWQQVRVHQQERWRLPMSASASIPLILQKVNGDKEALISIQESIMTLQLRNPGGTYHGNPRQYIPMPINLMPGIAATPWCQASMINQRNRLMPEILDDVFSMSL